MIKKLKIFLDSSDIRNTLFGDVLTVYVDDKSYKLSVNRKVIFIREELRWVLKNFCDNHENLSYSIMVDDNFYGVEEWIMNFHNIYVDAMDKSNASYLESMKLISEINSAGHLTHTYDDYENVHTLKNFEESNIHIKAKIKNGKIISVTSSARYYSEDMDKSILENFLKLL